VDSSPEVLENTLKKLQTAGVLHCSTTTDANEALVWVGEQDNSLYSLAIIDAKLANSESLALAREISRTSLGRTNLVISTGLATPDAETTVDGVVVENVLNKPIFMSQLLEKLDACLVRQPEKAALNTMPPQHATQKTPDFSSHRILIAEDIDINCEIIAALLEPTQVSITFAQNGREAVEAFCHEPEAFSLILMDLQMPEVDGHTATKTIRSSGLPRAEGIPIVAMTANVFQDDIDRSLAAGMNAHLGKPINIKELFTTIAKFIS
jgi:FOG: CheY-like receiver